MQPDSPYPAAAATIVRPREGSAPPPKSWRISDATGEVVVSGLRTRSLAIRMLGTYVADHALPLQVEDEHGHPTGDRLG